MRNNRKVGVGIVLVLGLSLAACAETGQVTKPDANGRLPQSSDVSRAKLLVDRPFSIGQARSLAVVSAGPFATNQIRDLALFGEVIDLETAEKRVIAEGLSESVLSLRDALGQNAFARKYKPYLLVSAHRTTRKSKNPVGWLVSDEYEQFVELRITDPLSTEVVFSAEIEEDTRWRGVSDKNTYYPLLNLMADWVRKHDVPTTPGQ